MQKFLPGVILFLLVAPSLAAATLISFEPAATTVGLGGDVAINIVATPEAGELIGEFDFNVLYDPGVLLFGGATFGPSLNDDPLLCAIAACRGAFDSGGSVNLFELSLVFPLTTLQDGVAPIVLATLNFDAIGVGTSNLGIVGNIRGRSAPFNILGDDFGVALPVFEPGTGTVTVVQVAEPPGLLLALTGLLIFGACRRPRCVVPT